MSARDKRIDAYIARSVPFARPVLEHLRAVVHEACPEVAETIKWGFPHFMYGDILCSMAAFKQHCSFGFWKGALLREHGVPGIEGAMGQFGRIASVRDLPGKTALKRFVKAAMKLNEEATAVKRPVTPAGKRPALPVPADLKAALARSKKAGAAFKAFPPGQRREYIEWITEAKRPETRAKRVAQTIEWVAEGKRRNWKYEGC